MKILEILETKMLEADFWKLDFWNLNSRNPNFMTLSYMSTDRWQKLEKKNFIDFINFKKYYFKCKSLEKTLEITKW